MKLIVEKSNYKKDAEAPFVKRNLVEVCKWFNFIEDNMHVQFPNEHITLKIELDYFIASPNMYTKNGAHRTYQCYLQEGRGIVTALCHQIRFHHTSFILTKVSTSSMVFPLALRSGKMPKQ